MEQVMVIWAEWLKPSAGLPTVQWSLLLALAAAVGHLLQRHTGLPKVVGYSIVGTLAGLAGFSGAAWPLQGVALFLLELGVSVVLFEAGGRIALRWFRHNPMVLLQSVLQAVLTAVAVYYVLRWFQMRPSVAEGLALISMAASPAVLSRVITDTRAAGPVTERAMVLSTLGTFYALTPQTFCPRLAWTNFALSALGVVVMVPFLALMLINGNDHASEPGVTAGSIISFLSMLVFAVSAFRELVRAR